MVAVLVLVFVVMVVVVGEDAVVIGGMLALVDVVVVDADSKVLRLFKYMGLKLDFIFQPLARGNHKGLSIEKSTTASSIRYKQLLVLI